MIYDIILLASSAIISHHENLWSLACGLAAYLLIIHYYSANGGQLIKSTQDATFDREDGCLVHYTTRTQLAISTILFLVTFFYIPSDITLSFSLVGILLSGYLFFDKNLSWSVAKTNNLTADLLQQVRQLQGVESLPDLKAILCKVIEILNAVITSHRKDGAPEIYLICASPALGAIHDSIEVRNLSKTYQVAIHTVSRELGNNLRVVHYEVGDSLRIFAEKAGLDNAKIGDFLESAKRISDILIENDAEVKVKVIGEPAASIIFSPQEVPSVMLFHMMVVKHVGGKSELVLWHVEHNLPAGSGGRRNLSIQGFWTTNQQIIHPFENTAKRYY